MSSRGNLILNYDQVRKLLGLPRDAEILDVSTRGHKEEMVFRLGSPTPVPGLTSDSKPGEFISEVAPKDYSQYLAIYYDTIYTQMEDTLKQCKEDDVNAGQEG